MDGAWQARRRHGEPRCGDSAADARTRRRAQRGDPPGDPRHASARGFALRRRRIDRLLHGIWARCGPRQRSRRDAFASRRRQRQLPGREAPYRGRREPEPHGQEGRAAPHTRVPPGRCAGRKAPRGDAGRRGGFNGARRHAVGRCAQPWSPGDCTGTCDGGRAPALGHAEQGTEQFADAFPLRRPGVQLRLPKRAESQEARRDAAP
mmetsp:Transcript_75950/g.210886  ORF Transcript_75950/g.210886 Transcript_75950/m.210886 type:complete len:206 (+) Transcript_75950:776-1393(+)